MKKLRKHVLQIAFFIAITPGEPSAKDLYLDINGDDSTPYDYVSISTPWKSINHALLNLKSGDILYIREGKYEALYQVRLRSTYDSQHYGGPPNEEVNVESGSANSPVIITSYKDEKVLIDSSSLPKFASIENVDYWVFKNISIVGGETIFEIGENSPATNISFENLYLTTTRGGDNTAAIKISNGNADNISILNSILIGPGNSEKIHSNTSLIYAKSINNLLIKNNSLSNAPIGIYFKHRNSLDTQSGITIKNNYISGTTRYAMELNSIGANIINNIFGFTCGGVRINEANGDPGGDFNSFSNNLFYGCGFHISSDTQTEDESPPGAVGNTLSRNIFFRGVSLYPWSQEIPEVTIDHNVFPNNGIYHNRKTLPLKEWELLSNTNTQSIESDIVLKKSSPISISDYSIDQGKTDLDTYNFIVTNKVGPTISKIGPSILAKTPSAPDISIK